jgi:hypothetical protein
VLEPLLVRSIVNNAYEIIAGERRWLAAKIASLKAVPYLVGYYDDETTSQIALIENISRENLNSIGDWPECVYKRWVYSFKAFKGAIKKSFIRRYFFTAAPIDLGKFCFSQNLKLEPDQPGYQLLQDFFGSDIS